MAAKSDEILHDFPPMIRQYKDGRIERLMRTETVPPSVDPETGVQSKDVVIAPEINLSARLYLTKSAIPGSKLPLLVYFHGGGFVVQSAFSPLYQKHLNCLVAEANVVVVSVDYRLAPEHPLPIAYEDAWLGFKWAVSPSNGEDWIKEYADLNRVFLGGDSAGGNIAHNIAVRFGAEKLDGVNLIGTFLNCPFFWGKEGIANEETHELMSKEYVDRLWQYTCPGTTEGCDDPRINPGKDQKLSGLGCKKLLVYVAENDILRSRGLLYKELLRKSGWDGEIEVVDVEGENHCYSVDSPTGEKGKEMIKRVASFLNQ
ncbi:Arylacetamide deacetylase [Handroanthus impetiginosus]|uniref:Arylacetamide deacetylase n=1 Tax=Handroanthus impetiginosus TaxID=429701 RepID=A0A2G9GA82_9LAMI|nr:Arylacetamide deacetylase [Handroanthus impetiginosus]